MPHDGIEGAFGDALHATPTATHVNERRILSIKANKCIAAANLFSQASYASLAQIVIDFEHDGASCSYGHGVILPLLGHGSPKACLWQHGFHGLI